MNTEKEKEIVGEIGQYSQTKKFFNHYKRGILIETKDGNNIWINFIGDNENELENLHNLYPAGTEINAKVINKSWKDKQTGKINDFWVINKIDVIKSVYQKMKKEDTIYELIRDSINETKNIFESIKKEDKEFFYDIRDVLEFSKFVIDMKIRWKNESNKV